MLPIATLAASGLLGGSRGYPFAAPVYMIGTVVCHQRSARAFHMQGVPMPVCARCTGIYVGGAIAAAVALAVERRRIARRRAWPFAVGLLPSAVTLAYEWSTGEATGNLTRAIAGAPAGAIVAAFVVAAASPSAFDAP
jgi:uncharacterized membrane protein